MEFYDASICHAVLKPKPGDCCVFCSYGTVPCPPIQQRGHGSGAAARVDESRVLEPAETQRSPRAPSALLTDEKTPGQP